MVKMPRIGAILMHFEDTAIYRLKYGRIVWIDFMKDCNKNKNTFVYLCTEHIIFIWMKWNTFICSNFSQSLIHFPLLNKAFQFIVHFLPPNNTHDSCQLKNQYFRRTYNIHKVYISYEMYRNARIIFTHTVMSTDHTWTSTFKYEYVYSFWS